MPVITMSRQFGSGGDEIAERICQLMDLHLFDKQLVARASVDAGLSDQEIIDYSEENYKVKNFLDRLSGRSRSIARVQVWREGINGALMPEEIQLSEENALALMKKAIHSAHKAGNILILGRGGQVLLKDCLDVLHVRIVAPLEDRILRVRNMKKPGFNQAQEGIETRREAQDLIEERDAASADYLKTFYRIDWSDPLHYHMVLNTGRISLEAAALTIMETARNLQGELTPA